jgi:ribonuclease R
MKVRLTWQAVKQLICLCWTRDDVFIPTNNLNHALDKDIVKVYVYNRRKEKDLKVSYWSFERNKTDFVGVIDIQKNFSLFLPQT